MPFGCPLRVLDVWYVLDILMVIGLALAFNFARKLQVERDPDGATVRPYLEAKIAFYLTVSVTILLLHNWFSLLALGEDSLEGNHQAWINWAVVDVVPSLVLGATGYRL